MSYELELAAEDRLLMGGDRMRAIVGIDPGYTTGLCLFRGKELVDAEEATDSHSIAEFIRRSEPNVVVMENYIVGKRPSRPKEPLKVIGAVEYICGEMGVALVMQPPSILSRMMKRADGTHPSKHVRSACAHVLYYLEGSE